MRGPETRTFFLLFVIQILFGGLPVASKFVLKVLRPWEIVTLRSVVAALVFLGIAWLLKSGPVLRASRPFVTFRTRPPHAPNADARSKFHLRDWAALCGLGLLGVSANQFALFLGLQKTTAAAAVILSPNIAFVSLCLSVLLGHETFSRAKAFNLVSGVVGIGLLFGAHIGDVVGKDALLGNALCLLSTSFYGAYLVLGRPLIQRLGAVVFSGGVFGFAAVFNLSVLFFSKDFSALELWSRVSQVQAPSFWWAFCHLVLGATVLTYLLNAFALNRAKPGVVSGFVCLQPLVGVAASAIFLREEIPGSYFLSLFLVLLGLGLLARENLKSSPVATAVAKG